LEVFFNVGKPGGIVVFFQSGERDFDEPFLKILLIQYAFKLFKQ